MKLQRRSLFLPILAANRVISTCRCLYGQPCWPNEKEFTTLATQLSQPLLHPRPPAFPCYPPSATSGNCSNVMANYTNGIWRSDQPGAMQNANLEEFIFPNETISVCYLNTTLGIPCGQGSVPPVGVDARSGGDIQAAVNFAKQHNLKLVVKNTGHDFFGRSTARGGFLIWTHNMKDTSYNSTFVPEGAPVTNENTFNAVTLGAGVQWQQAYDFAQKQGRSIVGGLSGGGTVGAAGGWVMGGGHSALSPKFGLGVDNVLQFTIVLADGSLITTNSFQHPDLFWALRGGGGGTYGVVTSTTYQTHPTFPLTLAYVASNFTSPAIAQNVTTEFIKLHPTISDAGWSGYITLSNTSFSALLIAPNISWADTNTTFLPFAQYAADATGGLSQDTTIPYNSFYEFYQAFFVNVVPETAGRIEFASRLLPRSLAETDPAKAAKIMLSLDGGATLNSVAGGAVSRVDPDSTGLNPSWRRALSEVVVSADWDEGATVDFIFQRIDQLKQLTLTLDQLTTDSGSYLNEGSLHELDFKKSYFGDHYDKLRSIKGKYDPTSLFIVAVGVGSDEWDGELVCRIHD
ncbi:FAD-binding domain-containing protein [Phlegmacium glaucopus]|nr:FAD-binding domain-containing protein [Phlegmacium glaucopus]